MKKIFNIKNWFTFAFGFICFGFGVATHYWPWLQSLRNWDALIVALIVMMGIAAFGMVLNILIYE